MQSTSFRNLRDWRIDGLMMTQEGLCAVLDVSPTTIYLWERGRVKPPKFRLMDTAAGYQISVDELIRLLEGSELQNSRGWPADYRHFKKKAVQIDEQKQS